MPLFRPDQTNKYPDHEQEMFLIDRISDNVSKILVDEKSTDLTKIKSALFDIVVLTKLVKKIGLKVDLTGEVKDIRDSIAHIDERLDKFDFKPTVIIGGDWEYSDEGDGKFKLSKTYNFQGAIDQASVSTSGKVKAVAPYGMIDDVFVWIDREGHQKHTKLSEMRNSYTKFLEVLKNAI